MRILIVNTNERTGGAATAANRLVDALNNSGEKAKMLVRNKETDDITVVRMPHTLLHRWYFLWERWCIFCHLHFSKRHLFELDIANAGTDITSLPEFKAADIIHLSWINQGMLSLKSIKKILNSGKPVVWTLHDIWPATAICHLTLGCNNFKEQCKMCKYLPGGGSRKDLSAAVWAKKKKLYEQGNIHFVACSKWLAEQAKQSKLLRNHPIFSIPNPLDTRIFAKSERKDAAKRTNLPLNRHLILFAAQRVTNINKGIEYLVEACSILAKHHPEMKETTGIVMMGGDSEELARRFDFPVYTMGYVNDTKKLVDIYNSVDVFVLPSLSENLPNTIMEAMSCGIPCVGFNVGGIPEEIDHRKNGYVAAYKDANDLAQGVYWILQEAPYAELSAQCVRKISLHYSQNSVAMRYIEVYNQALAFKKCKL